VGKDAEKIYESERACFMRSTAEMRLKFYGSDGKSYSTINIQLDDMKGTWMSAEGRIWESLFVGISRYSPCPSIQALLSARLHRLLLSYAGFAVSIAVRQLVRAGDVSVLDTMRISTKAGETDLDAVDC
jgi:hypothetical protein